MGCPEVTGQVGVQSTLATCLTIQLVLQSFPEVGMNHSLTHGTAGAMHMGRLVAPWLYRAAQRLHKQRRKGAYGSSDRPLSSRKTTESPEYAGQVVGLKHSYEEREKEPQF